MPIMLRVEGQVEKSLLVFQSGEAIVPPKSERLPCCNRARPPCCYRKLFLIKYVMRRDSVDQYVRLHRELTEERGRIRERLRQLDEALGRLSPVSISAVQGAATNRGGAPVTMESARANGAKRTLSAEARERIAEGQRRRWAARKRGPGTRETPGQSRSRRLARRVGRAARVPHA